MNRLGALEQVAALAALPPAARQALAACMSERHPAAGSAVVAEGGPGDCFYVAAAGSAEVTSRGILLNRLAAGDVFGEVALLTPAARRTATVSAGPGLVLLALPAADFHRLLSDHPAIRSHFEAAARQLLAKSFLKLASPFSGADAGRLQELAESTETLRVPAGELILREGERGDSAYCIVAGRVEVLRGAAQARIAELGPGAMFGEAAQLTGAPRDASVRAVEACELLVLRRDALLRTMASDAHAAAACLSLLRLRERPRRRAGVELQEGQGADGSPFFILADPAGRRYFRLSGEGKFVWDRLDGEHDLKAIVIAFFVRFKRFAPDMLAGLVNALADAGFVQTRPLAADLAGAPASRWRRLARGLRSKLDCQLAFTGCDAWLLRRYRGGIHLLFRRPALGLMAALVVCGAAAFALRAGAALAAVRASPLPVLMAWLIPAGALAMAAHECGHAFAVKACGKQVRRWGVGWHWVAPVLFVDTSEMWPADKRQRAAVSAAGIAVNLVLAGASALAAIFADGRALAALWLFAALSVVAVVLNLCPLGNFDGYHMLADWLDRPNLRGDTIRRIRNEGVLRSDRAEATYLLFVAVYFLGVASGLLALARLT